MEKTMLVNAIVVCWKETEKRKRYKQYEGQVHSPSLNVETIWSWQCLSVLSLANEKTAAWVIKGNTYLISMNDKERRKVTNFRPIMHLSITRTI